MKLILKVTGILFVLTICLHLPVEGQNPNVFVNVDEIQGLDPGGWIYSGATIRIPVRFTNTTEARTAISNGFRFFGESVTWDTIVAEWNPAYPWDWEHAFAAGCYPPACYPYFDQGLFINYFDNGVGFAGLTGASGSGLPAGFDDVAYFISIENIQGTWGTLTMDSTWWEPANYWLWSGVAENVDWGGPYEFSMCCPPPPPTVWCTPQPSILHESDPVIEFHVKCGWLGLGFYCEDVVLESVVISKNIPPLEGYPIVEDGILTTACRLTRFLGASGFRPIPPEGIQSIFWIEFDTYPYGHEELYGDYVLMVYQGDVNLDGGLDIQDAVFLTDYIFKGGPKIRFYDEELDELMDIDANGQVDLKDISDLIDMAGI